MIEKVYAIYTSIRGKSKLHVLGRLLIRISANALIPLYLLIFSKRRSFQKRTGYLGEKQVVVSLTTFPARINKLWIVLECLFRQSQPPDQIVLYLSEAQFPEGLAGLPRRLTGYQKRGLFLIRFVKGDLKSHKKYFYAFQEYPDDLIVLVDDDLFYTREMIQKLVELHHIYPNAICCHRARLVTKDNKGTISPYKSWKLIPDEYGPSGSLFHTSGGGTLYDPQWFDHELFNITQIKKLCFYADDIWLNVHAYLSGLQVVKSNYYPMDFPILNYNKLKLSNLNLEGQLNDRQLKNTLAYYGIDVQFIFCV